MEELIQVMSNEDLAGLKDKYADNTSVVLLIDGILETRGREQAQAKAKAQFTNGIAKVFAKLPHPEDISNIYVHWGEVDIPAGEPEELSEDVCKATGLEIGTMRTPSHKEFQWIVEVNKGIVIKRADGNGTATTGKRAITVYKRNGTQLEEKGHFISASKACEHLKLILGADSATRVLGRDGYIVEPYNGTDFTS